MQNKLSRMKHTTEDFLYKHLTLQVFTVYEYTIFKIFIKSFQAWRLGLGVKEGVAN